MGQKKTKVCTVVNTKYDTTRIAKDILNDILIDTFNLSESKYYVEPPIKKINIISNIVLKPPLQYYNVSDVHCNQEPDSTLSADVQARVHIAEILEDIINSALHLSQRKIYRKDGMLRKRKLHDTTLSERKKQKMEKYISSHAVKGICNCKKKCNKKIDLLRQKKYQ